MPMTQAGYKPPDKSAPIPPKQGKKPRKKRKKRRVNGVALVSLVIFLIAVLIASATLYIYAQTQPYAMAFAPGTSLQGYPLTSLSYLDGQAVLAQLTHDAVADFSCTLTWADTQYVLTGADISLAVDEQATLDPVWQVARNGGMLTRYVDMIRSRMTPVDASVVLSYDMDAVDALLERIRADVERDPVDATVTYVPDNSEPFRFTQEVVGRRLDTAPVRAMLEAAINGMESVDVEITPEEIAPRIYASELQAGTVMRARVVMTMDGEANALHNAQLAAQRIGHVRIEPGERFSFNETVGMRTAQAGYMAALEPAYGYDISGVGGGVCQVATAIYRAALMGDIRVITRNAAVYPVSYCDAGQEAAVSDQGLDLAIENNTQTPLFMSVRTYQDGDAYRLEVLLIGEEMDARYALDSLALETDTPEEPLYVRDSEGRYAVYTDERVSVGEPLPGVSAVVERVRLSADGSELSRETISTDEYEPIAQLIYVGQQERN